MSIPNSWLLLPEDCVAQAFPSVVATIVPDGPTAKQSVLLGQATSLSWVWVVVGAVCDVQVDPPFVVEMIVGNVPSTPPTVMQFDTLGQDRPCSATVTSPGGVCAVQVVPPFVV